MVNVTPSRIIIMMIGIGFCALLLVLFLFEKEDGGVGSMIFSTLYMLLSLPRRKLATLLKY